MKIECPSCQASYEVADSAIGEKGRNLRCAACGHYWFQKPADALETNKEAPQASKIKVTKETRDKPEKKSGGLGNLFKKQEKNKALPHQEMRKKAHDKIKFSHIGAIAVGWIGAIAILGVILGLMIGNRVSIVKKWPKSASFYAMLGVPVNLYGLEIKNIEVRSGIDEQGPRLMVLGVVKNVTNSAKALPYLRITLLDGHKQVATWLVDPNATFIDKGQVVNFQSIRRNPPSGNIKAIVAFADAPKDLSAEDLALKSTHSENENSLLLGTSPEGAGHEAAPSHEAAAVENTGHETAAPNAEHGANPPSHEAQNEHAPAPAAEHAPVEPSHNVEHSNTGH